MRKSRKINCLEIVKAARTTEELRRILETINIRGIRLLCVYYGCEAPELEEKILAKEKNEVTDVQKE